MGGRPSPVPVTSASGTIVNVTAMADTRELDAITVERDNGVVTIVLRRPEKKNAASLSMWAELLAEFRAIAGNADDRAVVITGAGGNFCSGADLWAGGDGPPKHQLAAMRHVGDVCLALHRLPQPTIAKVRGVAVGAGMNLALSCDLIVAAPDARFSEIFAKRGLSIDFGGSWLLPRLVGLHRAKELALFADIIDAPQAVEFGLVNRLVAEEEIDGFVADWAERLAGGPPIAMAMTKRLLNNSFNVTLEEALDDEGLSQTVNFGTKDTAEAIGAFMDRRDPVFLGR
jgi:2-(1,2-epoxy-1,2-dihydrophenyl)acetyl-CoA isomerase